VTVSVDGTCDRFDRVSARTLNNAVVCTPHTTTRITNTNGWNQVRQTTRDRHPDRQTPGTEDDDEKNHQMEDQGSSIECGQE